MRQATECSGQVRIAGTSFFKKGVLFGVIVKIFTYFYGVNLRNRIEIGGKEWIIF